MITRVRAFRQWQPFEDGTYRMSHAASDGLDSTIVALDTDGGVTGWGEMATITPRYADAFASGARAGVADLAPLVLGQDEAQPRALLARLDDEMRGQAVREVGASTWRAGTPRRARRAGPCTPSSAPASASGSRSTTS